MNKEVKQSNISIPFIHLVQNTWLPLVTHGWGNGYVNLPENHKWYNVHYDDIPVDVHGGLTFSRMIGKYWIIGFDTCHCNDTEDNWTFEAVHAETVRLLEQCL